MISLENGNEGVIVEPAGKLDQYILSSVLLLFIHTGDASRMPGMPLMEIASCVPGVVLEIADKYCNTNGFRYNSFLILEKTFLVE